MSWFLLIADFTTKKQGLENRVTSITLELVNKHEAVWLPSTFTKCEATTLKLQYTLQQKYRSADKRADHNPTSCQAQQGFASHLTGTSRNFRGLKN